MVETLAMPAAGVVGIRADSPFHFLSIFLSLALSLSLLLTLQAEDKPAVLSNPQRTVQGPGRGCRHKVDYNSSVSVREIRHLKRSQAKTSHIQYC